MEHLYFFCLNSHYSFLLSFFFHLLLVLSTVYTPHWLPIQIDMFIFLQTIAHNVYILFLDDVIIGKERLIGYEVKNRGTVTETYQVSISDDHSFANGITVEEYTLFSGDGTNGTFAVKPITPSVILYVLLV